MTIAEYGARQGYTIYDVMAIVKYGAGQGSGADPAKNLRGTHGS